MAYPKRELNIVHECDDEITGEPRCWSMASEYDEAAQRYHFIWICMYDEKEYIIEDSLGHNLAGKEYKSLNRAKGEAEGIIWRQDESGYYTD